MKAGRVALEGKAMMLECGPGEPTAAVPGVAAGGCAGLAEKAAAGPATAGQEPTKEQAATGHQTTC